MESSWPSVIACWLERVGKGGNWISVFAATDQKNKKLKGYTYRVRYWFIHKLRSVGVTRKEIGRNSSKIREGRRLLV